jgi:hypothetical protein
MVKAHDAQTGTETGDCKGKEIRLCDCCRLPGKTMTLLGPSTLKVQAILNGTVIPFTKFNKTCKIIRKPILNTLPLFLKILTPVVNP